MDYLLNDNVRKEKREILKAKRDELDNGPVLYKGNLYKMELDDIVKFILIVLGLATKTVQPDEKREWILFDNSTKEIDNMSLFMVLITKTERTKILFQRFTDLQNQLNMAKSVEEIEAIEWEVKEDEIEAGEGEQPSAELVTSHKKED